MNNITRTLVATCALIALSPVAPAFANSHVRNNLNAADGLFKVGMDGCPSVSMAILAASNPGTFGPVSASDRSEVARYARRCNLRF